MSTGFLPSSMSLLRDIPRALDPGPLYRVHKHDHPVERFGNRSIFRFDPPPDRQADFGTLYAATSPAGAFLEAFGSIRPLPRHLLKDHVLSNLLIEEAFTIADLTSDYARRLRAEWLYDSDFRMTQYWAAALWDAGFSGIQYFASPDSRADDFAIALLAPPDACGLLKSGEPEPFSRWLLDEVKDRFNLDVFDSGPLPW